MGVRGADAVEIDGDQDIVNILKLCDPRSKLHSEEEFIIFWSAARHSIDSFFRQHPQSFGSGERLTPEVGGGSPFSPSWGALLQSELESTISPSPESNSHVTVPPHH